MTDQAPTTPDWFEALHARRKSASKFVQVGKKKYRRFITPDMDAKDDGTVRCFACGQIDEGPWHEDDLCAAIVGAQQ